MRALPDNHWEYAESEEYKLARNALCNIMGIQIAQCAGTSDEIKRLICPLKSSRIEPVIKGGLLVDEIHGDIEFRIRGYVRTGDGTPFNKSEHCRADIENSDDFVHDMQTEDRIALTTYAYSQRRDSMRIFRKQCEKRGQTVHVSIQKRIFWMNNLFLRKVKLIEAGLS